MAIVSTCPVQLRDADSILYRTCTVHVLTIALVHYTMKILTIQYCLKRCILDLTKIRSINFQMSSKHLLKSNLT